MQPEDPEWQEIRLFLDVVYAEYGYDLRAYAPTSMRRRVQTAVAKSGLRTVEELRRKVAGDPRFFATVLEDLTVRVSELFRDPRFYRTFRDRVIPLLRTYPLLNIWHAGCATGEEVYSIAMLLAEEGLSDRTQLYATDLSHTAVAQAKEGVYPEKYLDLFTANYLAAGGTSDLSRYTTRAYQGLVVRHSLRSNVLFFQHDLVSDQTFGEMHVIFCRNVLIYFSVGLRERVLQKFGDSVYPGGFLCLGSSERLPRTSAHLFADFAPDEQIYRHRPFTDSPQSPERP